MQQTRIIKGFMTFVPFFLPIYTPKVLPKILKSPIHKASFILTAPSDKKTIKANKLEEKFNTFVKPVEASKLNPQYLLKNTAKKVPVPGPKKPS